MSYILNIDTAIEAASVCLSLNGETVAFLENGVQRDSASWLQPAIQHILKQHSLKLEELDAVAISEGPGSYTGLRVGMATAKGLCYAAKIPLILVSTFQMMTRAVSDIEADLFCPMIDARRMEVYTVLYDREGGEKLPPQNLILEKTAFSELLESCKILFFGNGSVKLRGLIENPNAVFSDRTANAKHLVPISTQKLKAHLFADLAYCEPNYGKAFFSPPSKPLL
ncbi:MAG TPA: tRNA (adenosine(37)-N6)-threonylcarbamoyltransferase complex dimerization subunit type 1 TsaB [Flavisolibacter sp.]